MKFNRLDFELYVMGILEEYKSETDLIYISSVMGNIVEGVADEILFEMKE